MSSGGSSSSGGSGGGASGGGGEMMAFHLPSVVTTACIVILVVFPVLATLFTTMRFWSRSASRKGPHADDWTILVALVLLWGQSITGFITGGLYGVNVSKSSNPLEASELMIRYVWMDGFMLAVDLALIKISLLLFYKTIFPGPTFRKAVWIMVAVLSGWGLSTVLVQLFMATPITDAWNLAVNHYNINYDDFYLAVAGMSLCFDVIVLCFPIPVISQLHMPLRRKLQVMGIFWLGGFCCISAAVRFYYLYSEIYLETPGNPSQFASITTGFIWSKIEISTSIIAACLPTLGPLFSEKGGLSFVRSFRSWLSLPTGARSSNKALHPSADSYQKHSKGTDYTSGTVDSSVSHPDYGWAELPETSRTALRMDDLERGYGNPRHHQQPAPPRGQQQPPQQIMVTRSITNERY